MEHWSLTYELLGGLVSMCKLLIAIAAGCVLSGCSGIDRWEAHQTIRGDEELTKQKYIDYLETRKPSIVITTFDATGRKAAVTEIDLVPLLGKDEAILSKESSAPKGVIAEAVDSIGAAGEKLLNTPAGTAAAVVGVVGGMGDDGVKAGRDVYMAEGGVDQHSDTFSIEGGGEE